MPPARSPLSTTRHESNDPKCCSRPFSKTLGFSSPYSDSGNGLDATSVDRRSTGNPMGPCGMQQSNRPEESNSASALDVDFRSHKQAVVTPFLHDPARHYLTAEQSPTNYSDHNLVGFIDPTVLSSPFFIHAAQQGLPEGSDVDRQCQLSRAASSSWLDRANCVLPLWAVLNPEVKGSEHEPCNESAGRGPGYSPTLSSEKKSSSPAKLDKVALGRLTPPTTCGTSYNEMQPRKLDWTVQACETDAYEAYDETMQPPLSPTVYRDHGSHEHISNNEFFDDRHMWNWHSIDPFQSPSDLKQDNAGCNSLAASPRNIDPSLILGGSTPICTQKRLTFGRQDDTNFRPRSKIVKLRIASAAQKFLMPSQLSTNRDHATGIRHRDACHATGSSATEQYRSPWNQINQHNKFEHSDTDSLSSHETIEHAPMNEYLLRPRAQKASNGARLCSKSTSSEILPGAQRQIVASQAHSAEIDVDHDVISHGGDSNVTELAEAESDGDEDFLYNKRSRGAKSAGIEWLNKDKTLLKSLKAAGHTWPEIAKRLHRSERACQLKHSQWFGVRIGPKRPSEVDIKAPKRAKKIQQATGDTDSHVISASGKSRTNFFDLHKDKQTELKRVFFQEKKALYRRMADHFSCSVHDVEQKIQDFGS